MKNLPTEIKAKIEEIKSNILPQASIPNSRLYKRLNLIEAEAVLQFAKSQNRPVRRAPSTECEFSKIAPPKKSETIHTDGLIKSERAADLLNLSVKTLLYYRHKGLIKSEVKVSRVLYFTQEEVYRFAATRKKESVAKNSMAS